MTALRVGVVGVGYLGKFHAEKYAAQDAVELVGVVDADQDRARQVAELVKTAWFDDPRRLVGKVDAVSIVAPTVHHHAIAKLFLEQGIHVLLEKPMTVTVEQADELITLADAGGLVLQVGHIERFNPAVTALRPLLAGPRYLSAERAAPFTVRCTDVSVVLDLMIHDLDIVMDLAGARPWAVSSAGTSVITGKIDVASARIQFRNGCTADVAASRVSDEKKRTLRVVDPEQVFLADYQTQQTTVFARCTQPSPGMAARQIKTERHDTLADEIAAFVHCIRTGRKPLVSGIEGRRALAMAVIIEKNIIEGKTEFVSIEL
jgi:predicted dehydrogenase